MSRYCLIGTAVITTYGKERRETVRLRATKNFYVSESGVKYRKRTGTQPAGKDEWARNFLDINTVRKAEPTFRLAGSSCDGRTNKWEVVCSQCSLVFNPMTTLLSKQSFSCPCCEERYTADWNEPSVRLVENAVA